jgi:hypothetical protein
LWREEMPGLGVPQQHQIIDVEDQRSGSLSGFGDSILRIFKTGELLHVTEADFQWPAQGKGLQDLPRFQGEVGRLCATLTWGRRSQKICRSPSALRQRQRPTRSFILTAPSLQGEDPSIQMTPVMAMPRRRHRSAIGTSGGIRTAGLDHAAVSASLPTTQH